jgi:hypothetical protein
MARGHFELWRDWKYLASYEYTGFDHTEDQPDWAVSDFYVSTELAALGTLTFGRQKEPYVYEMVGDAANLPHHERLLSPFFQSRNTGLRLTKAVLGGTLRRARRSAVLGLLCHGKLGPDGRASAL